MSSLLVVTGPPGVGKSAVAEHVARQLAGSVLVRGDAFFGFLGEDAPAPWLPEAHAQNEIVVEAAGSSVGVFVRGGYQTVYDGVLGPWFLDAFAKAAGTGELDYVVLTAPVDVCLARVSKRADDEFTDETGTKHMHRAFADADIEERHIVDSSRGTPELVADRVVAARAETKLAVRLN